MDPSIRPEVWEFLLGCYALSSTAEYRRQLRTARRYFTLVLSRLDFSVQLLCLHSQSVYFTILKEVVDLFKSMNVKTLTI